MHILSWPHKRHRIVGALAKIEPIIGEKAEAMSMAWSQLRDGGHFERAEETPEKKALPAQTAEAVPDYLR